VKIERKHVDATNGIVRVTTTDERWYEKHENGLVTYVPSVTWITDHYPKGIGFMKWLASKGWSEAEAIKASRGDKGSKVHAACNDLLLGKFVSHDAVYFSETAGRAEELTPEEYEAVMSFFDWYENDRRCGRPKCKKRRCLKVRAHDYTVWGDGYAGTGDMKLERSCDGGLGPCDIKTSPNIYESHRAQVQAYRKADPDCAGRGGWASILQLGYGKNKVQKYKHTVIPNSDFRLFQTARRIWTEQSSHITPHQRDYPLALLLKDRLPEDEIAANLHAVA
jgi:hypothetical protein